jgi:hypothetical protein
VKATNAAEPWAHHEALVEEIAQLAKRVPAVGVESKLPIVLNQVMDVRAY